MTRKEPKSVKRTLYRLTAHPHLTFTSATEAVIYALTLGLDGRWEAVP